jgi:hypothetical protein
MTLKRSGVACAQVAAAVLLALASRAALASQGNTPKGSDAVPEILSCLNSGQEAVLLLNSFECVPPRQGSRLLKESSPDEQACADKENASKDRRRLPGDAIKRIATQKDVPLPPTGIRIIGAIFCDQVDLVGLDLASSLVIDESLFAKGVLARNFHTRGDLSFDGSKTITVYEGGKPVRNQIIINRSRIDGALYAERTKLKTLRVYDSEIGASVLMRGSQLDEPAIFDTVSVNGELSVREARLSYFLLQFSKVGGILDLTDSKARCAYRITKNDIKELIAVGAGFGIKRPAQDEYDWSPESLSLTGQKIASAGMASGSGEKGCNFRKIAEPGTFTVSDGEVRTALCLRSFQWLRTEEQNAPLLGTMTLDDLKIGTTTWIDFSPLREVTAMGSQDKSAKPRLNIVGVDTNSLNLNFDSLESVELSLSGLEFHQVYASPAQCGYDPEYYNPSNARSSGNGQQFRLPAVREVANWLDQNCLRTSQPFSAFVAAARNAGDDGTAKALRITQANRDLEFRRLQWLGVPRSAACSDKGVLAASTRAPPDNLFVRGVNAASELVAIAFGILLGFIADYGYRPEKVVWFVIGAVSLSLVFFWWWLGVVGFKPKGKNIIRAAGVIFLFDRLIPLYNIRKDDYEIDSFYKRALGREALQSAPEIMPYLWFRIPVIKANETDVERVEVVLDWIRAIGVVLGIFLAAAVTALIRSQ